MRKRWLFSTISTYALAVAMGWTTREDVARAARRAVIRSWFREDT